MKQEILPPVNYADMLSKKSGADMLAEAKAYALNLFNSILIPPGKLIGAIRFDAGAGSITNVLASDGVGSVTRIDTGVYQINFVSAQPDAYYYVSAICGPRSGLPPPLIAVVPYNKILTTSFWVETYNPSLFTPTDANGMNITVFRFAVPA